MNDSIPFDTTVVSVADTFNTWRQKTNGIIDKVTSIDGSVTSIMSSHVTLTGPQSIVGVKTFTNGTLSNPVLKIDAAGLYYEGSILKATTPLQADTLIAATNLKLGSNSYTVPSVGAGNTNSYLTGNTGALSWSSEAALVLRLAASIQVIPPGVIGAAVLPVGSIIPYTAAVSPGGWKLCNGVRFHGVDFPVLAQVVLNTYGGIYTAETDGSVISAKASTTGTIVDLYSYTTGSEAYWYTLPDLRGRNVIGTGLGGDGIDTPNFIIGDSAGLYRHTLISAELPSHTHGVGTLLIGNEGAHTHPYEDVIYSEYGGNVYFSSMGSRATDYDNSQYQIARTTGNGSAHTHSITGATGATGSSTPFSILQPYLSLNYIIKSTPDTVVNTTIAAGAGMAFADFSLAVGGTHTLAVKYDSSLTINGSQQLGLANTAVTTAKIADAQITPAKIQSVSGGYIDWKADGAYFKTDKLATVTDLFNANHLKGSVLKLRERDSAFRNSSASQFNDNAYIDTDQMVVVNGANTNNRFGYADKTGHQIMPLPLNRKAAKLFICANSMACLDTTGQLWAIGNNDRNQFNISVVLPASPPTVLYAWTLAFDKVYTYLSSSRTIATVVLHDYNCFVIDSNHDLWAAGYNGYGHLGIGNTTTTNASTAKYQTTPTHSNVVDVTMIGLDTSGFCAVCIILSTNSVLSCGYNGYGQLGNGTTTNSSNWVSVTLTSVTSSASVGTLYTLRGSGSDIASSFRLVHNSGTYAYAWGYNDSTLGYGYTNSFGITDPTTIAYTTPTKIWDSSLPLYNNRSISKLYTTIGASYVLTTDGHIYATGSNSYGHFGNGNNTDLHIWTLIDSSLSAYIIDDLYVGASDNSYYSSNIVKCHKTEGLITTYYLFSAGWNVHGELGDGSTINRTTWTQIPMSSENIAKITDVQISYNYGNYFRTFLLLDDGTLYYTGGNEWYFDPTIGNTGLRQGFNRIK